MLLIHLFNELLKINSSKFTCILLLKGLIKGRRQHHSENIREKCILLLYLLLEQLLKERTQCISLDMTGRQTSIFGKLMNKSPKFLSHKQTLNKAINITSIPHILNPSISIANLPFLPILHIFLKINFPNSIFIKNLMNRSSLYIRIKFLLYLY